MILITSQCDDGSTNEVIRWIRHFGHDAIRVNVEDKDVFIEHIDLSAGSIILSVDGQKFDLMKDISVVWMRRGHIPFNFKYKLKKGFYDRVFRVENANFELRKHLSTELSDIIEYVHYVFQSKCIGGYGKGRVNKLVVLDKAKEHGIAIPDSSIYFDSETLKADATNKKMITKAISDTYCAESNNVGYTTYTEQVSTEDIHYLEGPIFPSLMQGEVDKKIELRVFYWFGEIHSLAIFSQNDDQTKTDFRIYNKSNPNRFVPFNLPEEEKRKLNLLMEDIGLQTGSVDYILDKDGNYVFLEVNPVGQFGMVSIPGMVFLEKKIAQTLIAHEVSKDKREQEEVLTRVS